MNSHFDRRANRPARHHNERAGWIRRSWANRYRPSMTARWFLSCALLPACMTASGSSPSYPQGPSSSTRPSQESRRNAVLAEENCKGLGVFSIDRPCDQVAAEQRDFELTQAQRNRAAIADASERQAEQAGADRELRGEALAGDGKHAGSGWFCFEGEQSGVTVGGCHRDIVECGMLMANRQIKGMATDLERCEESAAASCMQLTRSLKEGPRVFCFPQSAQCERAHGAAAKRDDVQELLACDVYR